MTRHYAVGVMNGNFRAGMFYRYAREVAADAFRDQQEAMLYDILETIGDAAYARWIEGTPDIGFNAAVSEMHAEVMRAWGYAAEQQGANEAHTRTLLECWAMQDAEAELGTRAAVSGGEASEF